MNTRINTTILTSVLFCFFGQHAIAQHIPDLFFADAIRAVCPACIDNNNYLTPAAQNLETLNVSIKNITSLAGIEGFTGLQVLNCADNSITEFPILPANLKVLKCSGNDLAAISSLPSGLTLLDCTNNVLTNLPELPLTLLRLDCLWNSISALPALPNSLTYLSCGSNQIESLPSLPPNLEALYCASNQLHAIPPLPSGLKRLIFYFNQITELPPLPSTLIILSGAYNVNLRCLPQLPNGLETLYIHDTQVDCLPNIPPGVSMSPSLGLCTEPCVPAVSTYEIDAPNPFTIQPNPVSDILQVRFNRDYDPNTSIRLINSNGQIIRSFSAKGELEIPVNNLPEGLYWLEVRGMHWLRGEKVLINRP